MIEYRYKFFYGGACKNMFSKKGALIGSIVFYTIGFVFFIANLIFSYSNWGTTATVFTIVSGTFILIGGFMTFEFVHICRKESNAKTSPNKLRKIYNSINDYGKIGVVHRFGRKNNAYYSTGKFALVKRFNGNNGYHLALEICGNEPLSGKDKTFKHKKDASRLFRINIAYYNGVALSLSKNFSGIELENDDLQGKIITFTSSILFNCELETDKSYSIKCGVIKVLKWNETNHVIAFKFIVEDGENAVYYGKLDLQQDTDTKDIEFNEEEYSEWLTKFEPLSKLGAKLERTSDNTFSKFGGMPNVPDGFKWPTAFNEVTDDDEFIPFLCQLDFAEINAACAVPEFPNKGLLYVFVDNENYDYKLLYFDKADRLTEAEQPDSIEVVYKEFHVSASALKTYPDPYDSDEVQDLFVDQPCVGAENAYCELQKNTLNEFMLGGWAAHVQEGGFISGLGEEDEWTLLMQIGSVDDDDEFIWGDSGSLYFYIRKSDLKALKFENVEMDSECY